VLMVLAMFFCSLWGIAWRIGHSLCTGDGGIALTSRILQLQNSKLLNDIP